MNISHEKSPCCQGKIHRFGQRRRQCSICGKTWSVWKRRRGKKRSRPDSNLLKKIFVEKQHLRQTAGVRLKRISLVAASKKLNKAMTALAGKNVLMRFSGQRYILVSDALWYRFQGQRWTLYLSAARTVKGRLARFLPPVLLPGKESLIGWQIAIGLMPDGLKRRTAAIVSDGWRGIERAARDNHWLLQRCHFHFISQLQVNRGKWKQMPDQNFREQIYQIARKLLTAKSGVKFYKKQLFLLSNHQDCPKRLRIIIHDYLRRLKYFRAYLKFPELNLPITTNCIESMNKLIREQCRYLNSPQALFKWSTTFLKFHPTVHCNGGVYTQN